MAKNINFKGLINNQVLVFCGANCPTNISHSFLLSRKTLAWSCQVRQEFWLPIGKFQIIHADLFIIPLILFHSLTSFSISFKPNIHKRPEFIKLWEGISNTTSVWRIFRGWSGVIYYMTTIQENDKISVSLMWSNVER